MQVGALDAAASKGLGGFEVRHGRGFENGRRHRDVGALARQGGGDVDVFQVADGIDHAAHERRVAAAGLVHLVGGHAREEQAVECLAGAVGVGVGAAGVGLADDRGGERAAVGVEVLRFGFQPIDQVFTVEARHAQADGAVAEQQRADLERVAGAHARQAFHVVGAAAAGARMGEGDREVARHLAGDGPAFQEGLAHIDRGQDAQLVLADPHPQVVAGDGLHAVAAQARVLVRDGVGVEGLGPGAGGGVELIDAVHRVEAQAGFELRFHQVVGAFHATLGAGVAGRVGDGLDLERAQHVLHGGGGVGAALVPHQHLGHTVEAAAVLQAPGVHEELEQVQRRLAGRFHIPGLHQAGGVVIQHVAPALELHLGQAVELVLVELVVADDLLLAAQVIDEAERRVDLMHVVGVQAAQLGGGVAFGLLANAEAAGAGEAVQLAGGDDDVLPVVGGDAGGDRGEHGLLAVGAHAAALHGGDHGEGVLALAGAALVGAGLAAAGPAGLTLELGIELAGAPAVQGAGLGKQRALATVLGGVEPACQLAQVLARGVGGVGRGGHDDVLTRRSRRRRQRRRHRPAPPGTDRGCGCRARRPSRRAWRRSGRAARRIAG